MISMTAEGVLLETIQTSFRLCATRDEASQICQDDLTQALLGLCDRSALVSNSSDVRSLADRMSRTPQSALSIGAPCLHL